MAFSFSSAATLTFRLLFSSCPSSPPALLLCQGQVAIQSLAALSRCTGGSAQTGSAGSRSWMPFVCLFFLLLLFFHKDVQMNVDVRSSGIPRDLKRCCDLDASLSDNRHRLSSVASINRCSVPPHSHPYNIVLYQSFPLFAYAHPTSLPSQWRWLLWLIRCSWGHAANESGVWRDNSVCICMWPRATTAFFSVLHIKDFLSPPLPLKKNFLRHLKVQKHGLKCCSFSCGAVLFSLITSWDSMTV